MKFDPVSWEGIYHLDQADSASFTFVRGSELAGEMCARVCTSGERWLDIGCGAGFVAARLAALGVVTIGIDHDPAMTALARRRISDAGTLLTPPNLAFLNADAQALPFADGTMDGVVAASLAGCLPSFTLFCSEVHRVLRTGGYAVITFTNENSLLLRANTAMRSRTFRRLRKLGRLGRRNTSDRIGGAARDETTRDETTRGEATPSDPLRILSAADDCHTFRFYDAKSIAEEAKKIGFSTRSVTFYNFFLTDKNQMLPRKSTAIRLERLDQYGATRQWGRNFVVVLQKLQGEEAAQSETVV